MVSSCRPLLPNPSFQAADSDTAPQARCTLRGRGGPAWAWVPRGEVMGLVRPSRHKSPQPRPLRGDVPGGCGSESRGLGFCCQVGAWEAETCPQQVPGLGVLLCRPQGRVPPAPFSFSQLRTREVPVAGSLAAPRGRCCSQDRHLPAGFEMLSAGGAGGALGPAVSASPRLS